MIIIQSKMAIGKPSLEERKYVRLLFYGGARNSAHNSAFYYAAKNVMTDYKNDGLIICKSVDTAKKIVDTINEQADGIIQSLDIFSHGGPGGLFFIKGASIHGNITEEDVKKNKLNSSLYVGNLVKILYGSNKSDDSRIVQKIKFSRFTKNAKIEMHGCQTCYDMIVLDNMCEELSELLYKAGKTESVVIGHVDKANPNINADKTSDQQQDYRHGKRHIFNNGKIIWTTSKKGRITASEINAALGKR